MRQLKRVLALTALAGVAAMAGCAGGEKSAKARMVEPATAQQQAQMLDRVKTLAGTWEIRGETDWEMGSTFTVSSNGSAVREVMFPGMPHEMTNMYHMDGDSIVMTHYCAEGNQPRMRCVAAGPDRLTFRFDSVTNLTKDDKGFMGEMTLVFVDSNNFQQIWRHMGGEKPTDPFTFYYRRKQ